MRPIENTDMTWDISEYGHTTWVFLEIERIIHDTISGKGYVLFSIEHEIWGPPSRAIVGRMGEVRGSESLIQGVPYHIAV